MLVLSFFFNFFNFFSLFFLVSHDAAVCSVQPAANTSHVSDAGHYGAAVGSNLGLGAPSTTTLTLVHTGEIQVVYMSKPPKMGAASSPAKDTCKTTINFHCDPAKPVGHPRFVEKIADACSYVFDWETSKACKLTEETGGNSETSNDVSTASKKTPEDGGQAPDLGNCRVSDESGYVFNMFGLHNHTGDYELVAPNNDKVRGCA